ncbi:hypothetical protein NDU88_005885 [Pleurodeles waltl]|uniref:Uncharacterized protein n=1 Tax=Pleurodeles waltl TaxID=8319 RepID=A0AAV7UKS0_PLEWA|nr:hypothetical protein NDU88_005885 [Pleurodeles waltl]
MEDIELVDLTPPLKLQKALMRRVDGDRKVSVLEIQADHPVPLTQKIPEKMDALHLEVTINHPFVERLEVYHRTKPLVLLFDQEDVAQEPPRMKRCRYNSPLAKKLNLCAY